MRSGVHHQPDVTHQVTQELFEGRDEIQAMFEREFGAAAMTCVVENNHEAGEVAAPEWRDPLGLRGCRFFTVFQAWPRLRPPHPLRLSGAAQAML